LFRIIRSSQQFFRILCAVRIHEYNANPANTFTLGHNAFSDLSGDEFAAHHKLGPYSPGVPSLPQLESDDPIVATTRRALEEQLFLPDYINWVQMGAVTPIKNQGSCGSCWAFSTTGALEGARFLKTGELVALSEQNLLDCDHVDLACNGGLMDNAFKFDEKSGGLCSEQDYPYEAKRNDVCNPSNCTDVPGSIVSTFIDVPPGNVTALISAIAMQPISIAIEASQFVFQFYKSGVINDDSCGSRGSIDHGVLAVGYGTDLETQVPYFLVKNSWGPEWGASGYVKIGRHSKNPFGICSILKLASFPVLV
jgi:C1A family cysteine protease